MGGGLVLGVLTFPDMFVGYFDRNLFIVLSTDFWEYCLLFKNLPGRLLG